MPARPDLDTLERLNLTDCADLRFCLAPLGRERATALMAKLDALLADARKVETQPCNICCEPWPKHDEHCAYAATALERDSLAAQVETLREALAQIMAEVGTSTRAHLIARTALAALKGERDE